MNKEEILSKSRAENRFGDEYDTQEKLRGHAFGLLFVTLLCLLIFLYKRVAQQSADDTLAVLWASQFALLAHRAYYRRDKVALVAAIFCLFFMGYSLVKFIMAVI